ncbi:MAG: hypothetical protein QGI78_02315 [Phycisphaerales bacterium]|jgi:hypothetical protein|nr:hypothetical protein [Phycisphaerales bacterium]
MAANSDYAQLAEMFTTVEEPIVLQPQVDLLLLGHLPVQGGLWLVPYAWRESEGGVGALLRMHKETVDLAIVGDVDLDISNCNSIEEAFELVAKVVTNWMVQPSSDADSTSLLHCDADRITLLSGADQAAVVGAYRLLKGLVVASNQNEVTPRLNLVIVGTEEKAANDAANRITQTAHHQLGVQLEVGHPLAAMGSACRVASQANFPRTSGVVDILSRIRVATQRVGSAHDTELNSIPDTPRPTLELEEPVIEIPTEDSRYEIEKKTLVSYVDGLIGIQPRCPEHEEVELAVDTMGRLHVLADAEDFRDVAIVASWAQRYHALLSMACGGIEIDAERAPKQHVFTSNAVTIADLHGTDLALHLLAEVVVEGHTGWFCTPLN